MADRQFQSQRIGRAIVAEVAGLARERGFTRLRTCRLPGVPGPEGFWRRLGFPPTGELDGAEIVAALVFGPPAAPDA